MRKLWLLIALVFVGMLYAVGAATLAVGLMALPVFHGYFVA